MNIKIGKGIELEIDRGRFTPEVNEYIFRYGLKQMLADANATIKKDSSEDWQAKSRSLTEKKLNSLYAGEVYQRPDRMGEIEAEARRLALANVIVALRKQGKKTSSLHSAALKQLVDQNMQRFMATATTVVAMRNQNEVEIDLGALDL